MISKSTIRLLDNMKDKIDNYQPSYCGDHLIDRVYIMENEPVYCIQIVRENGEEFYDLTRDYKLSKEEWNKHIDTILMCINQWFGSGLKGIYAYAYGYCHTIEETLNDNNVPKERLDRAHKELTLLVESFRGW